MHADVIGMPVESVLVERDDCGGAAALDRVRELGREMRHLGPAQIAVSMAEQHEFLDPETLDGGLQLARPETGQRGTAFNEA